MGILASFSKANQSTRTIEEMSERKKETYKQTVRNLWDGIGGVGYSKLLSVGHLRQEVADQAVG